MKVRYVKEFYGGSRAIGEINDWIGKTGNIIIFITTSVSVSGSVFYTVLYEEAE